VVCTPWARGLPIGPGINPGRIANASWPDRKLHAETSCCPR